MKKRISDLRSEMSQQRTPLDSAISMLAQAKEEEASLSVRQAQEIREIQERHAQIKKEIDARRKHLERDVLKKKKEYKNWLKERILFYRKVRKIIRMRRQLWGSIKHPQGKSKTGS